MKSKLAIAALILLPVSGQYAMAEEATPVEEPSLTFSAELGFLFQTGDNRSGDIKLGLSMDHKNGKWLNLLNFNALAKKSEQEDAVTGEEVYESTENKWNINGQTNYSIGEEGKNYLYGSAYYEQDKFSSFNYQTSASIGWGRHWIDNEKTSFFADIGPGIKYDELRADPTATPVIEEHGESAVILQAQALYKHKLNEYVEFKQYFIVKQAFEDDQNSIYKSETALTAKLIDALQFKFSFRVDYDTEVEEGYENTNTETAVTLLYSF
ncbi:DUF481 domain-containing protein [Colwellia echini]|uniref:DUF481 domain-containing protein n=1 Tax=Colwellia echini TaxID=1982103 RepID=A0ABY3MVP6_9GAMM|nr:DUF481 domain-containing protein [Colwellia echini]TYK65184.1 DUF481 domain-containing protein [Colwellia echini]